LSREQLCLRAAAFCLVIGSLTTFVARLMHGDLPADDAQAALTFIAARPIYASVHLVAITGALVAAGGFITLASTFTQSVAWLLGRLGSAAVVVGAAVYTFDFSTDGMTGAELASKWQAAAPLDKPLIVQSAGTVFAALHGPSLIGISVLWGLTLVLFGSAAIAARYPAWLGWLGLVAGGATFVGATVLFLWPTLFDGVIVYGLLVSLALLWSAAIGVAAGRRLAVKGGSPSGETLAR
jgi:hypothetical protein